MTETMVPPAAAETPAGDAAAPAGAPAAVAAPATDPALAGAEMGLFAPVYPLPRLEIATGKGARVTDVRGREYLDFVSGIAVNALGHAPSGLKRAVTKQMQQLGHCSNLFTHAPGIALARTLTALTGYDQVFFCNSGAEGIEAALKFARVLAAARGRSGRDFVAFQGGFHGRTGFAVSTTWTPSYRAPFEPLIPGVRFAGWNDLAALDTVLDENVAAVVVEPVQGEGGVVPATREFLQALRARTTALGAALVLDEVQCGMGRTGRFLAAEHFGVRGDFVVLSKALGGGIPLAAVLMTAEAGAALAPGMHGCTFGGNPVAAAAGNFMVGKIANPGFLAKVRKRGRELEAGLARLVARHPSLAEARGMGLLRAIEVKADAPYDPPALIRAAREHGLLLVRGGERAVRVLPPLNVTAAEITTALERLDQALLSLESSSAKGAPTA